MVRNLFGGSAIVGRPFADAIAALAGGTLAAFAQDPFHADEAIAFINRHGSHHTDCIITRDEAAAGRFFALVDSAGVYQNCSTRFADGYRYGFGAEVGISTGKIHARGPMGLEGLCSYKYILRGHGDIVGDFASGARSFTHKKLL